MSGSEAESVSQIDWIQTAYDALPTKRWMLEDGEIIREWEPGHRDTLLCYRKVPTPDTEAMFRSEADRYFAAHAPTFVKLLLRDNAQLWERVRQMKEALQAYRDVVVIAADMEGAMAHDHEQPPDFMKQAMSEALTEAERHDTKVKGWLEAGDSTEAPPHPEAKLGSTDA